MPAVLLAASSTDTAQPGWVGLLLEHTPYRGLRCNARSDSLLVYPAFGNKKIRFYAPRSTIWSPPKSSITLAINTDPMEFDVPMSPSPVPPPILPDTADSCTLTSPVPTQSVACFIDSAWLHCFMEFAAQLKDVDELEAFWDALWRWKRTFDPPGNSISNASRNPGTDNITTGSQDKRKQNSGPSRQRSEEYCRGPAQ